MKKTAVLLFSMVFTIAVNAKVIQGAGAYTCGEFSSSRQDLQRDVIQWMLGYLSSLNSNAVRYLSAVDIFKQSTSGATLTAALELYCSQNPLDEVEAGVVSIYRQLLSKAAQR